MTTDDFRAPGQPVDNLCPGGMTDDIYRGLAYGLCPSCNEFVVLFDTGETVRHFDRDRPGDES